MFFRRKIDRARAGKHFVSAGFYQSDRMSAFSKINGESKNLHLFCYMFLGRAIGDVFSSILVPFPLPFGSICPPFGSHWRIFGRSGRPWAAQGRPFGRTCAHVAFFRDFGVPGETQRSVQRQRRRPSGYRRKRHFAFKIGGFVWVSARSAYLQALSRLQSK